MGYSLEENAFILLNTMFSAPDEAWKTKKLALPQLGLPTRYLIENSGLELNDINYGLNYLRDRGAIDVVEEPGAGPLDFRYIQRITYRGKQLYEEYKVRVEKKEVKVMTKLNEAIARDRRKVFVVHGRNEKARRALYDFLRALHLYPVEWSEWLAVTGEGSPFIGDVLERGFEEAQAFVVLMTPDDEAQLRAQYRQGEEEQYETTLTPQPRPNVIFEAGMAMGYSSQRTVLVQLGRIRPISDIAGRHVVRINNSIAKRQELALKLRNAGCDVNMNGTDWHQAGDFDSALDTTS